MNSTRRSSLALIAAIMLSAAQARAGYFQTIAANPSHPQIGAEALFTSKAEFDGAATDIAIVFHQADPEDTYVPQALRDIGVQPVSWALLEIGGGGNADSGFALVGASANFAPVILGPAAQGLSHCGSVARGISKLIVSPDGSGLKLSLDWKAHVIDHAIIQPLNRWSFSPRFGVGAAWKF